MTKRTLNAFRAARRAANLTQDEAAVKAGVSQSIISELESGRKQNPTWDVLGRLCKLYQVRPEDLLPWPVLPGERQNSRHRRSPAYSAVALAQVVA